MAPSFLVTRTQRPARRTLTALGAICGALLLAGCDQEALHVAGKAPAPAVDSAEELAAAVTIYRDEWGVPHVYGPTDASVVFGFVYAQAEDNYWQIEDSMIQALGRSAEVYGEATLGADLLNRSLEIVALSKAEWERSPAHMQDLARAGATALNHYLATSGTDSRLIETWEPWHFAAWSRFAVYQLFVFNRARLKQEEMQAAVHPLEKVAQAMPEEAPVGWSAHRGPLLAEAAAVTGSNMWAVTPERSETGNALLFINPHQPYFGPGQWTEGHVHSDEGLHFSGAGFFGSLLPTIGHNEHLGWSHTVNAPDIVDVFELVFDDPERPDHYRFGDEYRPVTTWTDTVSVLTDNGLEAREFEFRRTHHGPIVGVRDGKPLAVRMAKFEDGGRTEQYYRMARARNLDEWKSAMSMTSQPMFNTVYADTGGNIFYVYNGAVPVRDPSHDWSKPVDGSDPTTDWQGYHSFDELPQITNPSSGYLQNCNATPFLASAEGDNPDPDDFPAYMVSEDDNNRSRMSRRILESEEQFSWEEWQRYTFDTHVIEAETTIPELRAAIDSRPIEAGKRKRLVEALEHLEAWDRVSTIDSTEMTLYYVWRNNQQRGGIKDPVDALAAALPMLEAGGSGWKVPWGELNRLQRRHTSGTEPFDDAVESLPVAGGPGNPFGIIFNFYSRPEEGQKRQYGVAGHSYVSVVDMSKDDLRAKSILVFGQNSDPGSPNWFDQSRLFAEQQYKPAWFNRDEVEANTVRSYHPGEAPEAHGIGDPATGGP